MPKYDIFKENLGTSLTGRRLRIQLPMQRTGFDLRPRKIPHAKEQLSPWSTTAEPWSLEDVLREATTRKNCAPQ